MSERAADAAIAAADERVAAVLATIERLDADDLMRTALPAEDAGRAADRAEVERLVRAAGLGAVLERGRHDATERIRRAFDAGVYRPTMVGLNWGISEGRTEDRVAAMRAAADAVLAAVAEPLAPDETLRRLDSPFELIERGHEVDTTFDLTRATARSIGRPGAEGWTARIIVAVVVVSAVGAIVGGFAPVGVALLVVAGVIAGLAVRVRPSR